MARPASVTSLVGLNALLMLDDADIGDLHAALSDELGCTWREVDPVTGALRDVAGLPVDARVAVALRRRPTATAAWRPFLAGLGVPLDLTDRPDTVPVLIAVRTATDPPRTVLWCFGTASHAVPNELVDGRFGSSPR